MRKKLNTIILLLILSSEFVLGKDLNKTKIYKQSKGHNQTKDKSNNIRFKRSIDEDDDKPFWANRGKKQIDDNPTYGNRIDYNQETHPKLLKEKDLENEPFWGTRGRRESADIEDEEHISYDHSNCKNCFGTLQTHSKSIRDDSTGPFWGMRGRRDSTEVEDEPFWGNRGRRQEDDPFWGTRGRRKDEPFWGMRGRREEDPFWGTRGRREDSEPFWGNRGRRQESEPFWGNRGRRQDDQPFWGNRGRRKDDDAFWGSRGRRKEDLKETIRNAINRVENEIDNLSRLKKSERSFWANRGRDSKLKALFNRYTNKNEMQQVNRRMDANFKQLDPGTVTDSRIYADEPNYILVERTSRSSDETDDPFFITRGKKYFLNYNLIKAARERRGALEEIVKSVRNDPYYIARGKKDDENATSATSDFSKVKELICSVVDMIKAPKENSKVKREVDNDRDRRTILKKLTAQLQNDPYFVSRGKKSIKAGNEESLREFVTGIAEKCY